LYYNFPNMSCSFDKAVQQENNVYRNDMLHAFVVIFSFAFTPYLYIYIYSVTRYIDSGLLNISPNV